MSTTAQFPFTAAEFAAAIVKAARSHCENTGDDHFIGDIQDILHATFGGLSEPRIKLILAMPLVRRVVGRRRIDRTSVLTTAYDVAECVKSSDNDEQTAEVLLSSMFGTLTDEELVGLLSSDIMETLFRDFDDADQEKLRLLRDWKDC